MKTATVEASWQYDGFGRLIAHEDFGGAESLVSRVQFYNDTAGNMTRYDLHVVGEDYWYTQRYHYDYTWFESAQVASIAGSSSRSANGPQFEARSETFSHDRFGNRLDTVYNAAGQVLASDHKYFYYHAGRPVSELNLTPLSEASAVGAGPGAYVVREGDTLQSIALAVYGDSQRWYLIADANGLGGSGSVTPGQSLMIPDAQSIRNASDTYRPLDPNEIYDNTLTLPQIIPPPPKADKSGNFIAFLAVVVSVFVTVITSGALAKEMWAWAAAYTVGAMAGNAAGQAINIAGGNQKGFDGDFFKAAAIAGAASGVFAGAAGASATAGVKAAYAAAGSIVGQGIAIELGYQRKFSWIGVAASAVSAAVSANGVAGMDRVAANLGIGMSSGIAEGMRSGEGFHPGLALLNAFGQAIGNSIAAPGQSAWDKAKQYAIDNPGVLVDEQARMSLTPEAYADRVTAPQSSPLPKDTGGLNRQAVQAASATVVNPASRQQQADRNPEPARGPVNSIVRKPEYGSGLIDMLDRSLGADPITQLFPEPLTTDTASSAEHDVMWWLETAAHTLGGVSENFHNLFQEATYDPLAFGGKLVTGMAGFAVSALDQTSRQLQYWGTAGYYGDPALANSIDRGLQGLANYGQDLSGYYHSGDAQGLGYALSWAPEVAMTMGAGYAANAAMRLRYFNSASMALGYESVASAVQAAGATLSRPVQWPITLNPTNAMAFSDPFGVGALTSSVKLRSPIGPSSSGTQITNLRRISSAEANAPFISQKAAAQGWLSPYPENVGVRTFTTADDLWFARLHVGGDTPDGAFLVRHKEIAHLDGDAEKLRVFLGLKNTPTHISDAIVPSGIRMQAGRIGAQPNFGLSSNSGFQYQLLEEIPSSNFVNTRALK